MNTLLKSFSSVMTKTLTSFTSVSNLPSEIIPKRLKSLQALHRKSIRLMTTPKKRKPSVLDGKPYAKGVVLKNVIKKPRKPNSANRKCVVVKLSIGKEMTAYVPGEGHNLQEHQTVLCRVSKLKDTPGVKIKCIRGKYDLPHKFRRSAT